MAARITPQEFLRRYPELLARHGSQRKVGEHLGVPQTTIRLWLSKKERYNFTKQAPKAPRVYAVRPDRARRFILSSAQDKTQVHAPFFDNMMAYAAVHIGGFTYNKRLFEENRVDRDQWFHPAVVGLMDNRQMHLGDSVVWCAEMNTLPTAVLPLEGFETYTGRKWGVFPHAKVQLQSIPTMKGTPAKQIMTTGAVTVPNYIQRRAGVRAHPHHVIGALLVEIDQDGAFFCRHLAAEEDGSFQDLNNVVRRGKVRGGHTVEAINWGDIHFEKLDPGMRELNWAPGGMIDALMPKYQFYNDSIDFTYRNHHTAKDPHHAYRMWLEGTESIDQMVAGVGSFFKFAHRDYCQAVVVNSNHDQALLRWMKESDWRRDPVNAEFSLDANAAALKHMRAMAGREFSALEWAVRRRHPDLADKVRFLAPDEPFAVCGGEIECGMHGHLGGNGAPGTPRQFTRMGPKANTGHTHSPGIIDGIYTAGVEGLLDMGYNRGLSSWAHAEVVTYPNEKRAIVTKSKGKWRAAV